MDLAQVRTKMQGFGMQLLDGIDPNPDNFVCAGIVHMRAQQVGCLLRLEPNKQAQVAVNKKQKERKEIHSNSFDKINIEFAKLFTRFILFHRCSA